MATRGSIYSYEGVRGRTWTAHVKWRGGQKKVGGHKSKAEAQRTLTALLASIDSGDYVAPSKLTVGRYADDWLDGLAARGRRATTIKGYRSYVGRYLDDELRALPIQDLSALHLDKVYGRLAAQVSLRTVRQLHSIVRKMLEDARKQGLVVRNVADLASPPSTRSTRAREMGVWIPAELRRFLEQTAEAEHGPLFRFAAMTGVRRGEMLGLRWSDVDFDAARVSIRQTVTDTGNGIGFDDVKTSRSRRTIDLDPVTLAMLKAQRRRQRELRLLVGPGWADHDLVFCAPDGRPWHPDSISTAFQRTLRTLDVPRIRLHDLRHTHATHLLAAGVNVKLVSERLGHASVAFTLDTYAHVLPGQQAEAAAAAAALVDGY